MTANFGGVDVVPLQGSLLRFGARVTTNFGGVDGGRCGVPLHGAV